MMPNFSPSPQNIDGALATWQGFPIDVGGFAEGMADTIRVVMGSATYDVGFDEAGQAVFLRQVIFRPDGINKIYQEKTIWKNEDGRPSFQTNSIISLAQKRKNGGRPQ